MKDRELLEFIFAAQVVILIILMVISIYLSARLGGPLF